MSKNNSLEGHFNKTLFCIYQSTSDDLIFWCWFDVIILSMNYGFDMTQISLIYTVSFWVSLVMKMPGNFLAKKLGAGRSVLLSAILFLTAALLLTFGSTLSVAILGQSIYLVAMSFQEMSTVIVKKAAARDPVHVDYMKIMSVTGTIYSAISLLAAIFMSRLYEINDNLPMYICIAFCLSSCVLAFFVSRYDVDGAVEGEEARRDVLPGVKIRTFDKTTLTCLFLSILFMVIFSVSGDNLKIMIENDLSTVTGKSRTVFLFSMILLASRLVKILSNLLLSASRDKGIKQERSFFFIVLGIVLISVFGFLNRWGTGYYAILLSVSAFLIRVLVFDPFRFSVYDFMLKRLKDDKMMDVLFVQSAGSDLFTALFSTLSTVLLKRQGMHSVMLMLLVLSALFAGEYFLFCKNLIRSNGNRKYLKWKQEEINSADSLMVASTALLMHYGIIADTTYTPKKLAEKVHSVENIAAANRNVQFDGFYDYDEETLKQFFNDGHPCAVRAVINEMDKDCWLPVMYLDDDGGVVWNPYSGEPFLAQLHRISEICCFTVV